MWNIEYSQFRWKVMDDYCCKSEKLSSKLSWTWVDSLPVPGTIFPVSDSSSSEIKSNPFLSLHYSELVSSTQAVPIFTYEKHSTFCFWISPDQQCSCCLLRKSIFSVILKSGTGDSGFPYRSAHMLRLSATSWPRSMQVWWVMHLCIASLAWLSGGPIDSDVHTNRKECLQFCHRLPPFLDRPSHQQVQPHSDPSRSPILGQPSHLEPQPHRQNALKRQIPLAEQGRPASSSPNQRKKPRQGDPAAHPIKPEHPQHSPVNSLQQQQPGPSGQSPSSMLHPHHDPNHRSFHRYGCSASTCSGRRFYTVNEFGIHVTGEHMIPVDVNEGKQRPFFAYLSNDLRIL